MERSVSSTNWLHAQPPRAPRPVCDLLLERLERCEAELSGLTDDGHEQGMCSIMFTDVAIHGDGAAKEAGSTVLLLLVKLCTTQHTMRALYSCCPQVVQFALRAAARSIGVAAARAMRLAVLQ